MRSFYTWWVISCVVNVPLIVLNIIGIGNIDGSILATANLFTLSLIRNEPFLNLLYYIVVNSTRSISSTGRLKWFKRWIHRLLHFNGDLHLTSAVFLTVWIALFIKDRANKFKIEQIVLCSIILGFSFIIILLAQRAFRVRYHNIFEWSHRYLGWTTLGVFLSFFIVSHYPDKFVEMTYNPAFILFSLSTIIIFSPWFFVRKIDIRNKIQHFDGGVILTLPGHIKAGSFVRISLDLNEWHAFGTANRNKDSQEFDLIIAPAGDWTKRLLTMCQEGNPPEYIYLRTIFSIGFMRSVLSYEKVLCVGTGGGIAPILSFITHIDTENVHILWSAKQFNKHYGADVTNLMLERSNTTLLDTSGGRPDLFQIISDKVEKQEIDSVFIVSNQPATYDLVHKLGQVDIVAYGAVWDS